ncbi:MAG TPA: right-handed parallel beta-helix repeat-containing protein [Mesorhizobium sp.]|jgi:hypothetical protein|uniref:right-handed parallel beta-helix repeat-containing protein n=1 Tax=Mesorhizobium sp. TaxID=1871066 RepID=UPI002DDD2B83|nr:right-handed parallel beta-helix repeat-containing protein [Mesorhizobium sp.]HEV2505404.1 right-handed parallel beta-helix repeat-containing protein [Mesorhizobium sp.]
MTLYHQVPEFASVPALVADTMLSYGGAGGVIPGDRIRTVEERFVYRVAAAASDFDIETAGGVRLRAVPLDGRSWTPAQFDAPLDGVTNADAALQKLTRRVGAGHTVDLGGGTFVHTRPLAFAAAAVSVAVRNGRLRISSARRFCAAIVARDGMTIRDITIEGDGKVGSEGSERHLIGIWGGASSHAGPDFEAGLQQAPAQRITIDNVTVTKTTVGICCAGASTDAEQFGWRITHCRFLDIVGGKAAGGSEGCGIAVGRMSDYSVSGCVFDGISRHAFWHGGHGARWRFVDNIIRDTDDVAIQVKVADTQPYAHGFVIADNIIEGVTRSLAAAVGIGIYGKAQDFTVARNRIRGVVQAGIDIAPSGSATAYGHDADCLDNDVIMPAGTASVQAAIRYTALSGRCCGNLCVVQNAAYGLHIHSGLGASAQKIFVRRNTLRTTHAGATAFRVAVNAPRAVDILQNDLDGFAAATRIRDTSTAGTVTTDL